MNFNDLLNAELPKLIEIDPAILPTLATDIVKALDESVGEDRVSVVLSYLTIRLMRLNRTI